MYDGERLLISFVSLLLKVYIFEQHSFNLENLMFPTKSLKYVIFPSFASLYITVIYSITVLGEVAALIVQLASHGNCIIARKLKDTLLVIAKCFFHQLCTSWFIEVRKHRFYIINNI